VYIKTTVDQISGKWQSKNTTIFVGTIIYQLHVSAVIGHLQVRIRQRKISIISIGMGGRDLVYGVCGRIGVGANKHMLAPTLIRPQTPYIGCPRRNVKYFGRVFLMLNYTDITQNTYIQRGAR